MVKNDDKSLKKEALKKLLEIISAKDFILNHTIFEVFETIESLIISKEDKLAKKKLDQVLKFQTRNGDFNSDNKSISPIYFLKTILIYFKIKNEKKEVKEYLKYIQKSIEYIENNFDNTYLLISSKNKDKKEFLTFDNALLLSICDELSEILNKFDFNFEADKLFMLKGKMELGFIRYCYNLETKQLLLKFDENGNFEIAKDDIRNKIILTYSPNEYELKKEIKYIKEDLSIFKFRNISRYLINLSELKRIDLKKYELEINKNYKILIEFPKNILSLEEFKIKNTISKSINKEFNLEFKEIKNKKIVIENLNCLNTINLVLKL